MTPTPPTSSSPRRRFPWYTWALLALVVVVGGAAVALLVMFPPSRVRAIVQSQLSTRLAREVRFSDARLGLWPPVRITVSDPALAEPGGFAHGTAFRAQSLHLDLDVLGLLARRVVVRRLVIDQPALHLLLRADGTSNLDSLGVPAGAQRAPATPMDLAVSDLRIRRGQVLVDDLKGARRTAFGFETAMSFGLDAQAARVTTHGTSQITDLSFGPLSAVRPADLNRSLAGLEWRIEHRGAFDLATSQLALERLALRFGSAELAFAGTVDLMGGVPALDLRAHGTGIDLGQVIASLSAGDNQNLKEIRGGGRLDFDLAVRGRMGPGELPEVRGSFSVARGSLRYPRSPAGVEDASFTARIAPDSLAIPDFRASVAQQPVRGSLEMVSFADPRVGFALAGQVDLAAVSPLVAPEGTRVAGQMTLDVRGRGRAKDPASMALEGSAKIADGSVSSPSLPKEVQHIQGEFGFSSTQARVRGLSAQAGQSSFTLDAEVKRPLALLPQAEGDAAKAGAQRAASSGAPAEIDFKLQSPYLDLAELLPPTPGGPLLPNARGKGTIAIGRLRNQKLDVRDVSARVELEPTELTIPRFACNAYGGAVSGDVRVGLTDPTRPQVALNAVLDSARVNQFLSTWTGAGGLLRGVMGTKLKLSTRGLTPEDVLRSLSAEGVAQLANGTLGPAPLFETIASFTRIPAYRQVQFRDFRTPFRVQSGRVFTGPAKLVGSYGEWAISGAVGFDGSLDYVASITVPPEMVSSLGATGALAAGALADDRGRVLIDLVITGNAKSPKVRWDQKAMRQRLLGRVSQALTGQRKSFEQQLRDTLGLGGGGSDSARAAAKARERALEDTLKKVGRDLLKSFFGSGKSAPKDTSGP